MYSASSTIPMLKQAETRARDFLSQHPIVDKLNLVSKEKGWKAYIVGGFSRDMLFRTKPSDVDMIIEGCRDINDLSAGVNALGFGAAKEKGTFDKHFDLTCNGTQFSIFRAENTYGGIGKGKATVKDVVGAFDFSLNAFIIKLPEVAYTDPFGILDPTFDEGSYFIMPTNNAPCINNRARTILRGLKLGAKFPGIELDELSYSWMQFNSSHLRKISIEDFDHILKGLSAEEKDKVTKEYQLICIYNFLKYNSHVKRIMPKKDLLYYLEKYTSKPMTIDLGEKGNREFRTILYDYKKITEDFEVNDTYFDTQNHFLSKHNILFRIREKRREGLNPFAEITFISGRYSYEDGLVVERDDFTKLTEGQRQNFLSLMDPFQFQEFEPVKALMKILSKHRVAVGELKQTFKLTSKIRAVVFQNSSVPLYTPFSDPRIKTNIAPDLGVQLEIRFNESFANGKELYSVEIGAVPNMASLDIMKASQLFKGKITGRTKLQLLYELD